jgi:FkbM family methyltransferase
LKRRDKIKLNFTRNWKFPGQERISNLLRPSADLQKSFKGGITWLSDERIAIYTTADNYIEWTILSSGTYESDIEKLISISLTEGDVALDIGGNIGLQSLRMAKYVGKSGKVLAFEPLNYLRKKFLKNIHLNRLKNINLYPYALSDQESKMTFSVNEHHWNQGTFSLMQSDNGTTLQEIEVKIADEMVEIINLQKLTLIKIDVEGFEFNVLKGLSNTIEKFKPRIIFEYDENYWEKNHQSMQACYKFLSNYNYDLFKVNSAGCELINSPANIVSGNLFCIQKLHEF